MNEFTYKPFKADYSARVKSEIVAPEIVATVIIMLRTSPNMKERN